MTEHITFFIYGLCDVLFDDGLDVLSKKQGKAF